MSSVLLHISDQDLNDAYDAFWGVGPNSNVEDQLDAALVSLVGGELVQRWRNIRDEHNLEDTVIVQGFWRDSSWSGVHTVRGGELLKQWIAGEMPADVQMVDTNGKVHNA